MARRNTQTGIVMERMVLPALEMGGYQVSRSVNIGSRLGVSRHIVDTLVEDTNGKLHLVSLKWQQVQGTVEQKIPFEVICLAEAMLRDERFFKAYLVLGGEGWKYKEFYLRGGLRPYLPNADMVNIVSMEQFVTLANQSKL